jgi:hypothetical protein
MARTATAEKSPVLEIPTNAPPGMKPVVVINPGGRKPGIYFNLSEAEYHKDPALGSTDIKRLRMSPPDYWWNSEMNPKKPEDDDSTPARIRGKALHKLVLEGERAFAPLYVRRPDDPRDASPADKSAITKAAKRDLCGNGETLLHGDIYDRVVTAGAIIRKDPELATAFQNGFSEVSVFWLRADGVMCKCRFDFLKPKGFADLKSITNTRDIEFRRACHLAIHYNGYKLQGTHYLIGRSMIPALVRRGLVFDCPEPPLLDKIAAAEEYRLAWVFYQAEGAPLTYSKTLSLDNPIVAREAAKIESAIDQFKDYMRRFGTKDIWLMSEPMTEIDESEMPQDFDMV